MEWKQKAECGNDDDDDDPSKMNIIHIDINKIRTSSVVYIVLFSQTKKMPCSNPFEYFIDRVLMNHEHGAELVGRRSIFIPFVLVRFGSETRKIYLCI